MLSISSDVSVKLRGSIPGPENNDLGSDGGFLEDGCLDDEKIVVAFWVWSLIDCIFFCELFILFDIISHSSVDVWIFDNILLKIWDTVLSNTVNEWIVDNKEMSLVVS